MRKISAIALTFATVLLLSSSALAQPSSESRWTLTPFLGAGFGGDIADTTASLGVASSYNFTPEFAVEGELAYSGEGADNDVFEFDSRLWTFSGNVIYHFTGSDRFLPYATAGLGLMRTSVDIELGSNEIVDASNEELAFNVGGGLKAHLTRRAHLRGDIRFFNGGDVDDNFWRAYGGVTIMLGR
jgi:opacity protein-like surface antigen